MFEHCPYSGHDHDWSTNSRKEMKRQFPIDLVLDGHLMLSTIDKLVT